MTSAPLTDEALPALQQLTATGSALPEHLPPPVGELDPLFQALQRSQRSSQLITALGANPDTVSSRPPRCCEHNQQPICAR